MTPFKVAILLGLHRMPRIWTKGTSCCYGLFEEGLLHWISLLKNLWVYCCLVDILESMWKWGHFYRFPYMTMETRIAPSQMYYNLVNSFQSQLWIYGSVDHHGPWLQCIRYLTWYYLYTGNTRAGRTSGCAAVGIHPGRHACVRREKGHELSKCRILFMTQEYHT